MPKYLLQASNNAPGTKGLLKERHTRRKEQAMPLFSSLGGPVQAFCFAFGGVDVSGEFCAGGFCAGGFCG